MPKSENVTATAGELVRQFSHYSDISLAHPVIVTKNGRPRNVLLSVDEYERLKQRDQQAFLAGETPDRFLADIETLARKKK
ncbi:MAG TPA: type II toxin-antitoxin system prevent-host-death family antitoxin [Parvibaculum sp.]